MRCVAPFVGAWIETSVSSMKREAIASLPSWERGLKPHKNKTVSRSCSSLPSWERGLKRLRLIHAVVAVTSLPSWERGLKHL